MGRRNAAFRREPDARSDCGSPRHRRPLARKLAETIVAMHARVPVVDADSWIAALDRFLTRMRRPFGKHPLFSRPISRQSSITRLAPRLNACVLACQPRSAWPRPSRPWRSSPRQHCPAGRASSAVRCDRIRPGRRCRRCPIRFGVSADGFAGTRSRSRCEYRLQRLFRSD